MIIIIEGPDGSGKTTLANQLSKQAGYKVIHRVQPKTEEEKIIIGLLKVENNQALSALKEKSQLSGKKWDAAMKGLAKHGLTKVVVDGDNKTVVLN